MLRWLLLAGLGFGLVTGVRNGWVELRWDRVLQDVGLPLLPGADQLGQPDQPAGGSGSGP